MFFILLCIGSGSVNRAAVFEKNHTMLSLKPGDGFDLLLQGDTVAYLVFSHELNDRITIETNGNKVDLGNVKAIRSVKTANKLVAFTYPSGTTEILVSIWIIDEERCSGNALYAYGSNGYQIRGTPAHPQFKQCVFTPQSSDIGNYSYNFIDSFDAIYAQTGGNPVITKCREASGCQLVSKQPVLFSFDALNSAKGFFLKRQAMKTETKFKKCSFGSFLTITPTGISTNTNEGMTYSFKCSDGGIFDIISKDFFIDSPALYFIVLIFLIIIPIIISVSAVIYFIFYFCKQPEVRQEKEQLVHGDSQDELYENFNDDEALINNDKMESLL